MTATDPRLLEADDADILEAFYRNEFERLKTLRMICQEQTDPQIRREIVKDAVKLGEFLKLSREEVVGFFGETVDVFEEQIKDVLEKKGQLSLVDAMALLKGRR